MISEVTLLLANIHVKENEVAQAGDIFRSLAKWKIADIPVSKVDLLIATTDEDVIVVEGVDKKEVAVYTSALYWKPHRPVPKPRIRKR